MTQPPTQKEYWSGKVGDDWAANAERLDAMLAPMTEAAFKLAAFQPGERVLDVGCGAGATSLRIARATGAAVTGVDLSPQLLAVARARAAGLPVEFLEADAGAAQLQQAFDAAFSRFGVMFFEEPVRAFANLHAHVRPGGRFVFVCWRALGENPWATAPIEAVAPMLKAPLPPPDPAAPGPFAFADAAKVERVLTQAGWREIALTRWDGDISIGGGGGVAESAEFMLHIGPCARAIAEQGLDLTEARQRLIDALASKHGAGGVVLGAACWLVRAVA